MAAIDYFVKWYRKFLAKRNISKEVTLQLLKIFYALLAIIFWYALVRRGMPKEFTITHFAFTLFVYSAFRLLVAFISKDQS
jgi:hypothetical protein